MTRLPILSAKELIQILGKLGYQEVRQRGSHIRLACPGRKPITIPNYKTRSPASQENPSGLPAYGK